MAEHTFSISTYLQEKQSSMLDALDENNLKKKKREKKEKEPQKPKEKTWETTYQLYRQGLTPKQIAEKRALTLSTIFGHLTKYIKTGDISLNEIIPIERQQIIEKVIEKIGIDKNTSIIKENCPPDVTYDEIRLVLTKITSSMTV
jgi:uncharacterized protein YpbB